MVQNAVDALSVMSLKYNIKTQASMIQNGNLDNIFNLTSIIESKSPAELVKVQPNKLMKDASKKFFEIKNLELQNKVTLKRLDYEQNDK